MEDGWIEKKYQFTVSVDLAFHFSFITPVLIYVYD